MVDKNKKNNNAAHAKCGAKTRSGGKCANPPVTGNKRCRMHGGKSTGPKNGHGIYRKILTDEEIEEWGLLDGTALENACKMAYIQHIRALRTGQDELADKLLGRIARLERTLHEIRTPPPPERMEVIYKCG